MRVWRDRSMTTFVLAWALLLVSLAITPSAAWGDEYTDRIKADARDQLQRHPKAPYPCSPFAVSSGRDGYIVDMTPWAVAAGLRRGDRPIAYGGIPLTGTLGTDSEVWARVPHAEYVDLRVDRAGKEVSLRLPCRDDRPRWEAYVAVRQAIAEGELSRSLLNLAERDGRASYPQFTARRRVPT